LRTWHDSIFDIRHNYKTIFPEERFRELSDDILIQGGKELKVYKIIYSLNLLTTATMSVNRNGEINKDGVNLMKSFSNYDYLDVFNTSSLKELIEYKWTSFSFKHHLISFLM
jgi:hypothetical protein